MAGSTILTTPPDFWEMLETYCREAASVTVETPPTLLALQTKLIGSCVVLHYTWRDKRMVSRWKIVGMKVTYVSVVGPISTDIEFHAICKNGEPSRAKGARWCMAAANFLERYRPNPLHRLAAEAE